MRFHSRCGFDRAESWPTFAVKTYGSRALRTGSFRNIRLGARRRVRGGPLVGAGRAAAGAPRPGGLRGGGGWSCWLAGVVAGRGQVGYSNFGRFVLGCIEADFFATTGVF